MASAVLEIRTTLGIISESIRRSLDHNPDPFNAVLLKEVLERATSGRGTQEKTNIVGLTYGEFFESVKYWLFYYPQDTFSWKITDRAKGLYDRLLRSGLHGRD